MPEERLQVGTDEIVVRVASAETSGALLAADVAIPPGGGPPVMHRHAPDEVYRGEAGELTVYRQAIGGDVERHVLRAGDVLHIPGGHSHTVRNESGAEARAYVVFTPGTEMERFVRAAAALEAPAPAEVVALAERHGVEFAGRVP
jgi:mannose-6-phosphate isomerase-like protein (cupin superfamily)